MMDDPSETDAMRARAARVLIELGDRSGDAFLLDAVRTGKGTRRASALRELDDWHLRRTIDLTALDRARLVLDALDDPDPDVVVAAASLAAAHKLPGTEAKLVAVIQSGASTRSSLAGSPSSSPRSPGRPRPSRSSGTSCSAMPRPGTTRGASTP